MSNILEYTLSLQDKYSAKLQKIGINNDMALDKFAQLENQSKSVRAGFDQLGKNVTTLSSKLALLRAERDMLPADSIAQIKTYNQEIGHLEKQISKIQNVKGGALSRWFGDLKSSFPIIGMIANPIALAAAGIYKLNSYIKEGEQIYADNSAQLSKLSKIMSNTMGATNDDVDAIKRLMDAQQRLGVISADVQSGGAQELSSYLSRRDSLERLLPVLNDMTAQQYGLNATQDQSVQIASMMGKVMDGQVGALSRYGYRFDEAQEKILKFGTEAERAATLADVISDSVGGVNEALRNTPEGILKAQADDLEDLKARAGGLMVAFRAGFTDAQNGIMSIMDKIITAFEDNKDVILGIVNMINKILSATIGKLIGLVEGFINKFKEGNPVILILSGILLSMAASMLLLGTYTMLTKTAFGLWKLASDLLNISLWSNPTFWIVTGIVALIAIITYLVMAFDGWGDAWSNLMDGLKSSFKSFGAYLKLNWLQVEDTFMTGVESIQKAWYKVKSLWDKEGAKEGLDALSAASQKRAAEIAQQKGVADAYSQAANEAYGKVFGENGLHRNNKNVLAEIKNKIGISAPGIPGTTGLGMGGQNGPGGGGSDTGSKTNEAIATGGTKNTVIHIVFDNMVETLTVNGRDFKESAENMQEEVANVMMRVLAMATATAN